MYFFLFLIKKVRLYEVRNNETVSCIKVLMLPIYLDNSEVTLMKLMETKS